MTNRDGTKSNGYYGSNDMHEDLYVYQGGYKTFDGFAKELGLFIYILHIAVTRFIWLKLWFKILFHKSLK